MDAVRQEQPEERDLAAIVLAAGHGRRMGVPKALLSIDGAPLVERHVLRLLEIGCAPVIVVLRPEVAADVGPRLQGLGPVCIAPARTSSQSASLVAGTRALTRPLSGRDESPADVAPGSLHARGKILITPVDMLPPSPTTLQRLTGALVPPLLAVTPTYRGRGGHPVVMRAEVILARVAGPSPLPSLRDVLEDLGPRRARVEVDDASVLGDFDAPSDLPAPLELLTGPGGSGRRRSASRRFPRSQPR